MRRVGRVAAEILREVSEQIRPGVRTADIDWWVRQAIAARPGVASSQLGYEGFPAAVCTSVSEVVCHGIPGARRIAAGDIVNVDVTVNLDGFHGDTSTMVVLPGASAEARLVVDVANEALRRGIAAAGPGVRIGDIGAVIEGYANAQGCGVVREFGGHGIGSRMHLPPHVCHCAAPGKGARLKPGMAFTLEPMITLGEPGIRILEDGWTAVTRDGSPSAQFEHTLLVTRDGVEVLTR